MEGITTAVTIEFVQQTVRTDAGDLFQCVCLFFVDLDAKSLHDRFRHKHRTELNRIQDRQATLDGLIARSDLLVSKLHKLGSKESSALVLLKELPSSYQMLKKEIKHKTELLATLDKHLIGPLALSAKELDLNERDNLISAIETTLNDEQREASGVPVASPITNSTSDAAPLQDEYQSMMDQDRHPQNGGEQNEEGYGPRAHTAAEVGECMEVDPKVQDSSTAVHHDMEVDAVGVQEPVIEGQRPEVGGQGTELLSSSVPGTTAEALVQQADSICVDAAMETDTAEMKAPSEELNGADARVKTPTTEFEASNAETKAAGDEGETTNTDVEEAQTKVLPVDVDALNTESVTSKAEVVTTTTDAESSGIQSTTPDTEGHDKEVERVLQENAVEMSPLQNYTNSPDVVLQQANTSSAQEESGKESEVTVCSTSAVMQGVEQHAIESTAARSDGEVERNVCETPEVSPASDGVSSPLGLESPKSTRNDPSLVPIRVRRRTSSREQGTQEQGEDSPPPTKMRKLSVDSFPQVGKEEDIEVPAHDDSLHSDQLPAIDEDKEVPRTMNVDGADGDGEQEQQLGPVQDDRTTSPPDSEQGEASPMDVSCTNVNDTVEEGVLQSPGKQEDEPSNVETTSDMSTVGTLAKSPVEETKSPVEEAKRPLAPLVSPPASGGSSEQVSEPAVAALTSPEPLKSPTYYTRKRSKSADTPVSGVEGSVGAKRRSSESGTSDIKSPVGSTMPSQGTSELRSEGEVHDATGQLDHGTKMDVSESSPSPEALPLKAGGNQSPVAEEPFSPVSSTEDATSSAAGADMNRAADDGALAQEDSSKIGAEVSDEGIEEKEGKVAAIAAKSPEETVERCFVESTDAALLSETYTEVDRALSPILEEESQDLLESDAKEEKLDEAVSQDQSPTCVDNASAPALCTEGESRDARSSGSMSSLQQLVDDTTAQRIESRSSSVDAKEDKYLSKGASPVPSEEEPVPPGTESDALEEAESATYHLSSLRGRSSSGSGFGSQGPAEVQMDTSASEIAPGGEDEELLMEDDTRECVSDEDLSQDKVSSDAMVDEMETEEHGTEVTQQQAEGLGNILEEPSSANVDSCDAKYGETATPGEGREEDFASDPENLLDSEESPTPINPGVVTTPTQCVASLPESLASAAELLSSPNEAVVSDTRPITPLQVAVTSPTEHTTSTEPITYTKEATASPTQPIHSPNSPVKSPEETVTSPKEPVTSPEELITSTEEPITSTKEPISSPEEPITSPKEYITSPREPITSPKEPITSPKEPIAFPREPITSPKEPITSPKEPIASPEEPIASPREPITSPAEDSSTPEEPVTTVTEPSTSSGAGEQANSHSHMPTAVIPAEDEGQKGPESPVDVSPLEEALLDDLLDETGQVTQGGSEEVHELQPSDISLLDDDWSSDQQLAEPAAVNEEGKSSSDGNTNSEQQGPDYRKVDEEIEQSTAKEPGTKGSSDEGERTCTAEEESVDLGYSLNALDPSTSEQKHTEEEAAELDKEAERSSATAPTVQEPGESSPDQSESKEMSGSSGNAAVRGLVAYGDSGSSSEEDNFEESASSNPTQSAVSVQPETGEQLLEGSRGNIPEETDRLTSSGGSEAATQKSDGSTPDEVASAGNGQEDMDTSTVEEEDCSEEMDLS